MPPVRPAVVTIAAFLVSATVLSLIALSTPEWIVQDLHGTVTYGLVQECYEGTFAHEDRSTCEHNKDAPAEWYTTLVFIVIGTITVTISAIYAVGSIRKPVLLKKSKYFGLATSVTFSLATLIFPAGFDAHDIDGTPYRLPDNAGIGFSYVLFVVALIFVFIAELLTMKVLFEENM